MNVGQFPPADSSEKEIYALDFRRDLAPGEALVSASMTLTVVDGADAAPNSRLIGPPAISGTTVRQRVGNLQIGASYRLQVAAVTNQGNTRSLWARISCEG